jgi:hypothetical protein
MKLDTVNLNRDSLDSTSDDPVARKRAEAKAEARCEKFGTKKRNRMFDLRLEGPRTWSSARPARRSQNGIAT